MSNIVSRQQKWHRLSFWLEESFKQFPGGRKLLEIADFSSIIGLFVLLPVLTCQAQIITVDDDLPADFNNIQAAIDDANDGDTVEVQPGRHTGPGNRDIDFKGKAITVRSIDPNDPNIVAATVIDCNGLGRGFHFYGRRNEPDSVLDGLTIMNGYGHEGGGICCDEYASPTIRSCRIVGNSAMKGGGVYIGNGSTSVIDSCLIAQNSVDSLSYQGQGGGIYCSVSSDALIINCIVSNNQASGSYIPRGTGGGIALSNCPATVRHCTIVNNTAAVGGGISCNRFAEHKIANCIIWANAAPDSPQISGTPAVSYSDVQGGYPGNANIDADPLFVDPTSGNYHLTIGSLCVDSGDPQHVPSYMETDIDGEPRVMGLQSDMGADEFTSTPTPIIGISPASFTFHATQNGPNPDDQILSVYSAGFGDLSWKVVEDGPWLEVDPCDGLSSGEVDTVNLSVDISDLALGEYICELTITADGASNSPQRIPVTLYIRPAAGRLHVPSEYKTIQSAINAAQNGDTVILAEKIYTGPGNRDLDFKGKAITVRSTDPSDPDVIATTVIDCNSSGRGFYFHSAEGPESVLAGVTITNGRAKDGCGIYIINSSPTITHCIITDNSSNEDSSDGGGVYIRGGSPTIRYCLLSDNSVESCGGGVFCYNSSPTIIYCTIRGNRVRDAGAGICCLYDSKLVISYCTIRDNVVSFRRGGGVACRDSPLVITNCVIAHNSSGDGGGGLWLGAADAEITQCTITGNYTSGAWGGGVYFSLGTVAVSNSILWDNSAPDGAEIGVYSWRGYYDGGPDPDPQYNAFLTVSYSTVKGGPTKVYVFGDPAYLSLNWGPGNTDADPCFASSGYWHGSGRIGQVWIDGDYHLKSQAGRWDPVSKQWVQDDVTSPCIDKGNPMTPIGFEPFPNGGIINMGAYGGTAEASKSYFGKPPCEIIVAGDINGDCIVDFKDFSLMSLHWLQDYNP